MRWPPLQSMDSGPVAQAGDVVKTVIQEYPDSVQTDCEILAYIIEELSQNIRWKQNRQMSKIEKEGQ